MYIPKILNHLFCVLYVLMYLFYCNSNYFKINNIYSKKQIFINNKRSIFKLYIIIVSIHNIINICISNQFSNIIK